MIRHKFSKYNAKKTTTDGITFHSKKEAAYYLQLKALKENGDIVFFLMQTPFHLPGGVKYLVDFQVFWTNGDVTFIDVKGIRTQNYTTKKKLVEALYPITITEI